MSMTASSRFLVGKIIIALCSLLSFSCLACPSEPNCPVNITEKKPDKPDMWNFSLDPYLWMAGENGFVKIQRQKANLSTGIGDLRHTLDFGGDVHFEARHHSPWSFYLEPMYVKVTQYGHIHHVSAKTSQATTAIDGGAYYLLWSKPRAHHTDNQASLEIMGGGRIMSIYSAMEFYNNAPNATDSSGFIVPILGARLKYNFNPCLHSWTSADFGGFHITHVTSTWSAMIGLSYDLTKTAGISLGYKALGVHYYKQSDTINTVIQGPIVGMTLSW